MKAKWLISATLVVAVSSALQAASAVQFGLNMGAMAPDSDTNIKKTFATNFTTNGSIAWLTDSGFGLRGSLGIYSDTSHNPDDAGKNFRIDITQLKATALYQFSQKGELRPYLGAGVGSAFYTLRDDQFGNLESGTRFGFHVIAGTQFFFTDSVFGSVEYEKQFLSKIFFNNSQNFDTSAITLGLGFQIPINPPVQRTVQAPKSEAPIVTVPSPVSTPVVSTPVVPVSYPYSQREEEMLTKIQQLRTEIGEMKTQVATLQTEVDEFYSKSKYDETNPKFARQLQAAKFKESKIAAINRQIDSAFKDLSATEAQWQAEHPQRPVVEREVIYLNDHYRNSPWGLRYSDGFYHYGRPYIRQYSSVTVIQQGASTPAKTPSEIQQDNANYLNQKRDYINNLKNR